MARTVQLSILRSRARTKADMVTSQFVTDAEFNQMLSDSWTELYDLLTTAYEDYYSASTSITLVGGTDTYSLPADFYKLLGVDLVLGSQTFSLKRFNWADRNLYRQNVLTASSLGITDLRYQLRGGSIVFIPIPAGTGSATLWYIQAPSSLVNDTDTIDGQSGWDEYVVTDAAIKALQKEESDVSVLMAQKESLKRRILGAAKNRDAGSPRTISDVRRNTP